MFLTRTQSSAGRDGSGRSFSYFTALSFVDKSFFADAAAAFVAVWFVGKWLFQPAGATALHWLFAAYFAHLAFRTLWLTVRHRREVLGAIPDNP